MDKWAAFFQSSMSILLLLAVVAWLTTYHPPDRGSESVSCVGKVPMLRPGQKIKVMTWNVQYFAGKNYVFFYDLPDGTGPDSRPSPSDITQTLGEVARVIKAENPDVILLQEIDDGARRTDYEDQLERLQELLGLQYPCWAQAYYWKAWYVPHPKILGKVGMKLVTLSKYQIDSAVRHQLPVIDGNPIVRLFNFRRAVLETTLPVEGAKSLVVMNTHLDAFAQGTDTMKRQVAKVDHLLREKTINEEPWILGGDFNLLAPGQYAELTKKHPRYAQSFNPKTELKLFFDRYAMLPTITELRGSDSAKWSTHFPNDPAIHGPTHTIDYLVHHSTLLKPTLHYVRSSDTQKISDHLPLVAEFQLEPQK